MNFTNDSPSNTLHIKNKMYIQQWILNCCHSTLVSLYAIRITYVTTSEVAEVHIVTYKMSNATAELLLLYSTDIIHTLISCDKMTYTDILALLSS